jgi:hypothetical protein
VVLDGEMCSGLTAIPSELLVMRSEQCQASVKRLRQADMRTQGARNTVDFPRIRSTIKLNSFQGSSRFTSYER